MRPRRWLETLLCLAAVPLLGAPGPCEGHRAVAPEVADVDAGAADSGVGGAGGSGGVQGGGGAGGEEACIPGTGGGSDTPYPFAAPDECGKPPRPEWGTCGKILGFRAPPATAAVRDASDRDPAARCPDGPGANLDVWLAFDGAGARQDRDIFVVRPGGCDRRLVIADSSDDREAAFSPDGRSLAFASDRAGAPQVFVKDLVRGTIRQLTTRPEGASQPAWSPTGEWIAFRAGPFFQDNPSLDWSDRSSRGIFVIPAEGGADRKVADPIINARAIDHPIFTGAGTIVVDGYNFIGEIMPGCLRFIVGPSTTRIETPTLSPDGVTVAFGMMCDSQQESVWTTDLFGHSGACKLASATRLTAPSAPFARRPAFGPRGLVAVELGTVAQIAFVAAGREPFLISPHPHDQRNPAFSPPGAILP